MTPLFLISTLVLLLSSHVISVETDQTDDDYQAAHTSWTQGNYEEVFDHLHYKEDYNKNQHEGRNIDSSKPSWVSALSRAWTSPERRIDLASLGIDIGSVFDRLLSPAGIVNQFALSFIIQLMFIVGYIGSGRNKDKYRI